MTVAPLHVSCSEPDAEVATLLQAPVDYDHKGAALVSAKFTQPGLQAAIRVAPMELNSVLLSVLRTLLAPVTAQNAPYMAHAMLTRAVSTS